MILGPQHGGHGLAFAMSLPSSAGLWNLMCCLSLRRFFNRWGTARNGQVQQTSAHTRLESAFSLMLK